MATIPRCSVYNGTVLPNKPEFDATKYPNWLILYGTDSTTSTKQYIWLACSKPFLKYAEGVYVYPADSEIIGFGANKSTCTWNSGTITKDEGLADYYTFSGTFVWSFMPIYLYSDQTVIAHQAGDMVTEWDAETPTITSLTGAEILTDDGTGTGYWQGDTATALTCTATVSDGGTLSYKWYRNGTYVSSGSSYTPSTATAGSFLYQCTVTNTRTAASGFSDVDTIQSDILAIVVTAKEDPDTPDTPDTPDSPDTPVVPDVKASKHKHIIGYVLKQCGVPMAELIAEMLCKNPDIPTAAMYLYGSDCVVSYNGINSPAIEAVYTPELQKRYPFAHIAEFPASAILGDGVGGSVATLMLSSVAAYHSNGETLITGTHSTQNFTYTESQEVVDFFAGNGITVRLGEWTFTDASNDVDFIDSVYGVAWTNYDILNADGSVYLAASEPVHSGNIGLRSGESVTYYKGHVAPELPMYDNAKYNKAMMTVHRGSQYTSGVVWAMNGVTFGLGGGVNGSEWRVRCNSYVMFTQGRTGGTEWLEGGAKDEYSEVSDIESVEWANFDIINQDGTVYLPATEPIPVYGIVDTINGIPIYEIKE